MMKRKLIYDKKNYGFVVNTFVFNAEVFFRVASRLKNQPLANVTEALIHEDGLPYNDSNSDIFFANDAFVMTGKYIG